MSPTDTNFNEIGDTTEEIRDKKNGVLQKIVGSEEMLNNNAINMPDFQKLKKFPQGNLERSSDDEEKLNEYLRRSDTAVIYPEAVGRPENGEWLILFYCIFNLFYYVLIEIYGYTNWNIIPYALNVLSVKIKGRLEDKLTGQLLYK